MLSSTQAATLQAIIYHVIYFLKYRLKYFLNFRSVSLNSLSKLRIGFNNNFITNSSYTKFLGVTMDDTLSWNNDIDLLVKKLSTACYKIRNAKTYMSASSLKRIMLFFYSAMSCGIIFWGNSPHSSIIFRLQKKLIRSMEGCGNRVSCRKFI